MSRRTRTTAVLVAGAALLSAGAPSGALAHGDHGDKRGGDHGKSHGKRHHGDRGLGRIARELGVTKEQLRAALKTVAEQQQSAAKPASFKDLLAKQLGVTTDQLKTAAEQAKASGADSKDEWRAAFANALGVDVAKVTAAFDAARTEQKAQWKAARDAWVAALAQQLGVPADKVEAAFERKHHAKHH